MRRNPPAKWVLPEAVDPPTTKCFVIEVPDDPQHIAAFRGALLNLASAYKWADDATHMAKDVALRWRQAIEEMAECDMAIMLRTNPFDSCGAQVSYDGGTVWEEFFNARDCATTTVEDMFSNDEVPGGANPDPDQCFDLDLVIDANTMKLIPLAISGGWRLSITQLHGAWNGAAGQDWVCPTGKVYFFGQCSNLTEGTQSGDPINTIPHMQLIIRLPDGTYDEIDLDGSEYVVPSGQPSGNTFLMANDSTLSDNSGSVSLHLLACAPSSVVHITYGVAGGITLGHGPSYTVLNSEFTVYSDAYPPGGSNYHVAWPIFDRCVKVQVISYSGWTCCAGGFDAIWYRLDCGGGSLVLMKQSDYADPSTWPAALCIEEQQTLSATAFSLTLKVTEWDCT